MNKTKPPLDQQTLSHKCIFCKIGTGETSSEILYRDASCFVIRDINPIAAVHLLVIPNRHFTSLYRFTNEEYSIIGIMFEAAKHMADVEGILDSGYRMVFNQGTNAGQIIEHLHLHVLGGKLLGAMG